MFGVDSLGNLRFLYIVNVKFCNAGVDNRGSPMCGGLTWYCCWGKDKFPRIVILRSAVYAREGIRLWKAKWCKIQQTKLASRSTKSFHVQHIFYQGQDI